MKFMTNFIRLYQSDNRRRHIMNIIQVIMLLLGAGHAITIVVIDRGLVKRGIDMKTRKTVLKCELGLALFVLILMSCLLWNYS
jgi:hypothetical protein